MDGGDGCYRRCSGVENVGGGEGLLAGNEGGLVGMKNRGVECWR